MIYDNKQNKKITVRFKIFNFFFIKKTKIFLRNEKNSFYFLFFSYFYLFLFIISNLTKKLKFSNF